MAMQGKSFLDGAADMPKGWPAAMHRALDGEISRKEDDLTVLPDGRQRWLRWEVRPWISISGEVAGIVIFSEDITTPKEAASAAAASEARLRAIIESMHGAMIVTDPDGNIESCNPAAITL